MACSACAKRRQAAKRMAPRISKNPNKVNTTSINPVLGKGSKAVAQFLKNGIGKIN